MQSLYSRAYGKEDPLLHLVYKQNPEITHKKSMTGLLNPL